MIKEIEAKTILSHLKKPDPWFGIKYNMNLYRGCQHGCIYCDSRSDCYRIEDFDEILVKRNAIELLEKELRRKRKKGTIGTGSMNDPYMPVEKDLNLTGSALELLAKYRFPVHVITKSDLVIRDVDILRDISRIYAAVSFTITTSDIKVSRKLEPSSPSPYKRFEALKILSLQGIYTGITLMPVLPHISDTKENILSIVHQAKDNGAQYILASFGMTMREGQREYFYQKLDQCFPGLRKIYQDEFGFDYVCPAPYAKKLEDTFKNECAKIGLDTRMNHFVEDDHEQLSFF